MLPDLFTLLKANTPVKNLLGTTQLRVFPAGRAPEESIRPYAVYSVVNGTPENYLSGTPSIDNIGTQISVYAETFDSLINCFNAIRNALEPHAHMTNYATPDQDADTNLFSCRMEFDFWDKR
jgi:hypothetical protein